MNDFLARLAARQVGALPGVAPRLRSRFEPAPAEEVSDGPSSEPPAPSKRKKATTGRPRAIPARPKPERPAAPLVPPAASKPPLLEANVEPPPKHAPKERRTELRSTTERPGPDPDPPPARRVVEAPGHVEPAPLVREAPTASAPASVHAEPDEERSPPEAAPRLVEPLVQIADPQPLGNIDAFTAPETPRAAEEPPDVRVTIGRIEIRAVPPPPEAPRRRAKPRSAPSLEEYLERRKGARR